MNYEMTMENVKIEGSKLSATMVGNALHLVADKLVDCFDESGAINYLDISFEHANSKEVYNLVMTKQSGISQGEKISILNAELEIARDASKRLTDVLCRALMSNDVYGGMLAPIVDDANALIEELNN